MIVSKEPLLVADDQAASMAMVDEWAAPAAQPVLERQLLAARDQFLATAGGPFTFDSAALAVREHAQGAGSATVDVWCAEVLFRQAQPVSELFLTERLGLVWWQVGWRLTSVSEVAGPYVGVAAGPTPGPQAAAALDGFSPAVMNLGGR